MVETKDGKEFENVDVYLGVVGVLFAVVAVPAHLLYGVPGSCVVQQKVYHDLTLVLPPVWPCRHQALARPSSVPRD